MGSSTREGERARAGLGDSTGEGQCGGDDVVALDGFDQAAGAVADGEYSAAAGGDGVIVGVVEVDFLDLFAAVEGDAAGGVDFAQEVGDAGGAVGHSAAPAAWIAPAAAAGPRPLRGAQGDHVQEDVLVGRVMDQ